MLQGELIVGQLAKKEVGALSQNCYPQAVIVRPKNPERHFFSLKAMLISPDFLYMKEMTPVGQPLWSLRAS